ncbi:MAG: hypothetical protein IJ730_00630 [Alphaproteobacteria bacterium]|nr:hypothetical protein [Alphaproteobacteria bacterium]
MNNIRILSFLFILFCFFTECSDVKKQDVLIVGAQPNEPKWIEKDEWKREVEKNNSVTFVSKGWAFIGNKTLEELGFKKISPLTEQLIEIETKYYLTKGYESEKIHSLTKDYGVFKHTDLPATVWICDFNGEAFKQLAKKYEGQFDYIYNDTNVAYFIDNPTILELLKLLKVGGTYDMINIIENMPIIFYVKPINKEDEAIITSLIKEERNRKEIAEKIADIPFEIVSNGGDHKDFLEKLEKLSMRYFERKSIVVYDILSNPLHLSYDIFDKDYDKIGFNCDSKGTIKEDLIKVKNEMEKLSKTFSFEKFETYVRSQYPYIAIYSSDKYKLIRLQKLSKEEFEELNQSYIKNLKTDAAETTASAENKL